jgi:hypothetical protein
MTMLLNLDEWLAAASAAEHPRFEQMQSAAEFLVQSIANAVAEHCDVVAGEAQFGSHDEGGICCALQPLHPDQQLPDVFIGLDDDGFSEDEWVIPDGYRYRRDRFEKIEGGE